MSGGQRAILFKSSTTGLLWNAVQLCIFCRPLCACACVSSLDPAPCPVQCPLSPALGSLSAVWRTRQKTTDCSNTRRDIHETNRSSRTHINRFRQPIQQTSKCCIEWNRSMIKLPVRRPFLNFFCFYVRKAGITLAWCEEWTQLPIKSFCPPHCCWRWTDRGINPPKQWNALFLSAGP